MRNLHGPAFKISGIFHAGSYDPWDFLARAGTRIWAQDYESSIIKGVDHICVGTRFSKDLLLKGAHYVPEDKVHITGLPLDINTIYGSRSEQGKTPTIIFPHRLSPEKGLGDMVEIADGVMDQYPLADLVITSGRKLTQPPQEILNMRHSDKVIIRDELTKTEYYRLLSECTVALSTAKQETFGYSMLEATTLGCCPIVPNRLSYVDIYPRKFRYSDNDMAVKKILKNIDYPAFDLELPRKYNYPEIIQEMLYVCEV